MRIILHIDMNSYFASVEQQARPALRGKPIGVTGSSKKRTIIAAASVEAKKFGVKTGTQLHEAKRLCPQIILVGADCQRYEAVTKKFLDIFISKTPNVEIFSIDEAFLDVTNQVRDFTEAEKLAGLIKMELKVKVGKFVKCSIGIAQNKFMAKLASEAKKPDGLTTVLPGTEISFLDKFELTDACGIGSRINARLHGLGVKNFHDLRKIDQTTLTLLFNSYGLKLYNMARGIDSAPLIPYFNCSRAKSISRSKTLAQNVWDKTFIKKMILSFCQNIAAELRAKSLSAGSIGVWLRFGDFTHTGQTQMIKRPSELGRDLFLHGEKVLDNLEITKPVRKIGIYVGKLKEKQNQVELFDNFTKPLVLEKTADRINQRYGKKLVTQGSLINLGFSGQAPAFGFKKDIKIG